MKILVTGANGFVGRNLCCQLKNIRDGKCHEYEKLHISDVFEYDIDSNTDLLAQYCDCCDFVFNLAGANRPKHAEEFISTNAGFASDLLNALKSSGNQCPVMLASSQQASLIGRFSDSEYGRSKLLAEKQYLDYTKRTGCKVLIYRFPNVFGKWCRPNYNSAIATFCNNIANDLPIRISDPNIDLELVYIDDLVHEMILALTGNEHHCDLDGLTNIPNENGEYCYVPTTHKVTLGYIVDCLNMFKSQTMQLYIPKLEDGSFEKKLYSTFISYLPVQRISTSLKMNVDDRGSFTELLRSTNSGQVSVNISKPGITKGQHWHNSKWEYFIVVKGHALIEERSVCGGDILRFDVSGDKIEAVRMLPGYTHSITNLSNTDDLVTVMWANELFDKEHPDTYFEPVTKNN